MLNIFVKILRKSLLGLLLHPMDVIHSLVGWPTEDSYSNLMMPVVEKRTFPKYLRDPEFVGNRTNFTRGIGIENLS